MRNIIRVLAKEVRRLRALVEVAKILGVHYLCATKELESMKRMLAMLIRREM